MFKVVTMEELIAATDTTQIVFCDTETKGLYGEIRLLQAYQRHWDDVLIVDTPGAFNVHAYLTKNNSVWHNAHYDLTTVQQNVGGHPVYPDRFEDTFLLARLAMPHRQTYSLDDVMTEVLGRNPYAHLGDKKELQKSNWSAPKLTQEQLEYAAIDVKYMPEVWDVVCQHLDDQNYILDKSTVVNCLKIQWNGMPVIEENIDVVHRKTEARLAEINLPINANSYVQVRKWLGVTESNAAALSILKVRDGNQKASDVMEVRSLRKTLNFLTKYSKARVIGKLKPSARSGRLTSDDENIQQIPRTLKKLFGYSKGSKRTLIYSDYAQLELRTICAIVGVSIMEKLFRTGEDLHGYVASILFGENWTKSDRQVTKTFNFNLLYGGAAKMVCSILMTYGFYMQEREANKHKAKWLNLFKELNKWQQEGISAWRKGRLGSTPFGRQYTGKLMTDQLNIENQGAGAEVTKLAMHYFVPLLEEFNASLEDPEDKVLLCNVIHDSFVLDAPRKLEIYQPVAAMLAECMQRAWFEMSKCYKIHDLPMPVNVRVGQNWGDIEADIFDWEYDLTGQEYYNV